MSVKKVARSSPNVLLRKARLEQGWSQKELADLIGVPQSFMISRWENGTARPGPIYREKLSSIFGKQYGELGLHGCKSFTMADEIQLSIIDSAIPARQPGSVDLVGRQRLLEQVKDHLCSGKNDIFVGLDGLPGVGKTALMREIAIDPEVQEHFADGILWASAGPQANISRLLCDWCNLLGIEWANGVRLSSSFERFQALRRAMRSRQMLLILDDVWTIEDALACIIGGPRCAYLLASRIPDVATLFAGNRAIHVPELSTAEGMEVLELIVPTLIESERPALTQLVQAVGGLPLMLILIGNYLLVHVRHRQQRRIQRVLEYLQQPETRMGLILPQARIDLEKSDGLVRGPLDIRTIIGASEAYLDSASRRALQALASFPAKPDSFSEEEALALASVTRDSLDRLVSAGLVECSEEDRYQIHQVIMDYALMQAAGMQMWRQTAI